MFLHRFQGGLDLGGVAHFDLVLRHEIIGISGTQRRGAQFLVRQVAQEERRADEGIAAVVQVGDDHPAVALSADDGTDQLHHGGGVHFPDLAAVVAAAVRLGHVAQRAGRGDVRNRRSRFDGKDIVGHGHERIFFAEGHAVFTDESQPVHVGIDRDAQVGLLADHRRGQIDQVGRQRLRIMGETAVGFPVDGDAFHAQLPEKLRHADAAHGVDGVEHHFESGAADGFQIDERMMLHGVDMCLREIFPFQRPDTVHVHEFEVFGLGYALEGLAFGVSQEFAFLIEQLQGVPLLGVVRSRQDDAAVGVFEKDGHFRRRRRREAGVYDIDAAGEQGPRNDAVHHLAGNAGVAAHDHFQTLPVGMLLLELAGISRREFDDVDGGQRVADGAADGAPDAGNGFDQGHIVNFLRDFL